MPVSFRSNQGSLFAQREMRKASDALAETYQRLSSGLRINQASDDAAGLALADTLRAQARIADVAIRNANDGISITAIADDGLEAIQDSLTRMLELAQTSANGAFTNTQRSALALEFDALGSEIDRIASSLQFNNRTLLSNSSSISFQVGLNGNANSQVTLTSVIGTLDSLGLAASGTSRLSFSIIDISTAGSTNSALNALSAVQAAIDSVGVRRGVLGATESRLSTAINFLAQARDNFAAAEDRIRNVDVAEETARLVALQVTQQAATAMFAQANQEAEIVLRLLG